MLLLPASFVSPVLGLGKFMSDVDTADGRVMALSSDVLVRPISEEAGAMI